MLAGGDILVPEGALDLVGVRKGALRYNRLKSGSPLFGGYSVKNHLTSKHATKLSFAYNDVKYFGTGPSAFDGK